MTAEKPDAAEMPGNGPRSRPEGWLTSATVHELRELEARFDARFQAVSARFVRVDNRFAGLDMRLDELQRRHDILEHRTTNRLDAITAGLEAADARVDDLRQQLGGITHRHDQLHRRLDQLGHRILAAVIGGTLLTVALWAISIAVWLSRHG